ncbi:hypothetical protein NK983_32650, partial [Salmonella enterica subsp. enterica serovar Typhimurium]|nr:hypothetical protein [Salmonella enterica subsp. enterica serovar Typhimurium]
AQLAVDAVLVQFKARRQGAIDLWGHSAGRSDPCFGAILGVCPQAVKLPDRCCRQRLHALMTDGSTGEERVAGSIHSMTGFATA